MSTDLFFDEIVSNAKESDGKDTEAPYGRRADGTPRGKPGPKRGASSGPRVSAPPRARSTSRTPAKPKAPDYRPGITGLLQVASFPLAVGGRFNPNLALDAAAVSMHAPTIAEALNTVAQERPEVAAALEKVLSVGPYGLLIGAVIPLIAQIGVNHNKLPQGMAAGMGAIPKDELAAQLNAQAQAMQNAAS